MVSKTRVYNCKAAMVAAGCMVLYGYDAAVFNAVQANKHWLAWFNTPKGELLGLINTSYSIGAIVSGWFLGGPTADLLGRRWGMFIGCFITIIATFIQTFSPRHEIGVFIFGRVLIGIGQGMALTAGPVYIGEITPPTIRGKVMSFWQLFYSVGAFIAYWVNYACAKHSALLGEWDWKMVVMFQMLVPFLIICQLPFLPETPRWYIQHGDRIEDARRSLVRVRDSDQEVEDEILAIREAITFEKEVISGSYLALWKDASVRKRLLLAFVINIGQQLSGQGTLNSYSSTIYKKVFTSTNTINLINALNATCGILFTLNATWTVDRFGRKFLFIGGAIGMACCMLIVPIIGLETPDTAAGGKSEPVGIAIVAMLFLFIFFYKPSWGATTWIWTSEIFSMNVRSQAVGMCSQMQNVAQSVFNQFFPTFYNNCGLKSFFFFMTTNICLAFFVWFCIPETKSVSLEEVDVLFGGANHTEKGGDLLHVEDAHHAHIGVDNVDHIEPATTVPVAAELKM
ncbi:major facilitator superfamily transporter sugar [Mollisia scopiformis]|uniref:Major facilitator superfamily transporter sugar n=1 Tax=Mollisia scopiformis TaxID=149040 RepID=A0A132B607_MOLSC|nr:major facilitator superfamily transporter sugar [Mollisia scopiformis]KUJ07324.1 major facilitator superfamily transporter sugar [Mollisia scopiformis]